jgi:transposase InsO family protein
MSLKSRKEYLRKMRERYTQAKNRKEKSRILDEVVDVLGYHRKHAIQVLNGKTTLFSTTKRLRKRPRKYLQASSVIEKVWEALDYPCAERLKPVLLSTAEHLAAHGSIVLTNEIREQLEKISRSTLSRRISQWRSPKPKKKTFSQARALSKLRSEIPVEVYHWDEKRPGALEIDLVEHNGGSSLGHFAYTLTVVDIVTGYSRRRALLGRSQNAVFNELKQILSEWPYQPWGLHSDNGSEFLNNQLYRFCKEQNIHFTRSRPYRKNDNAHVEQKNRQFVREIVGYERYDTPDDVAWLNQVYACLDPYANFFLPMRKVVLKERNGAKIRKKFDNAKTPFQRLIEAEVLSPQKQVELEEKRQAINLLDLRHKLESLINQGPSAHTQFHNDLVYA